MIKDKIFKDCVVVDGNCYRVKTTKVSSIGCVMVAHHPVFKTALNTWILIDEDWAKTNMRDGILAHECGHIALGHHLIPKSVRYCLQKLRDKSYKLSIQLEIDADTWACYHTPFKEELLKFVEYLHVCDPECIEYKMRLENLKNGNLSKT